MKIGINCGHTVSGTRGCGAVGLIDESVETRRVGNKLMLLLSKAGHTVYNCTDDYAKSTSDNLNKIVNMANRQKLDLFVSIHFNSSDPPGYGSEVYTYKAQQLPEAQRVLTKLSELGFRNRGIKSRSLAVIDRTEAKAMLIEVCFVNHADDVSRYQELGADAIAAAIADAITGQEAEKGGNNVANFKDIKGHYAEKHINDLKEMGVVNGDDKGNFRPNDVVTRADVAIMVRNAIRYVTGK